MLPKPTSCSGCPLEKTGTGYAPAVGPKSKILLVGEALGRQEAAKGEPFVGPSGAYLDKALRRVGLERANLRIDNSIRCQPPNDWLVGAPWERGAIAHCRPAHLDNTLSEGPKVAVAIGATATRVLLGLPHRGFKLDNWHGTATLEPGGRFYVVPTYHPAFILRGNHKLTGVFSFDLQVGKEVSDGVWEGEPADLVVDPSRAWFESWINDLEGFPDAWLAVDIETDEKLKESDEQELSGEGSTHIVRINFSYHPDQGITVPWEASYLPGILRLLSLPNPKLFWNERYDIPILRAAGCHIQEPVFDFMWGWHLLQSDLPRGLGFVAPFYSKFGAWKHLNGSDPGRYAAIDAIQTLRVARGIAKDLTATGAWASFSRHVYDLDRKVLHPAEAEGILVSRVGLAEYRRELVLAKEEIEGQIQEVVPDSLKPEVYWKRKPEDPDAEEVLVQEVVQQCVNCFKTDVAKTHNCGAPDVQLREAEVKRWRKKLPFNAASPKQVEQYINSKGLKTKGTTDEKALEALYKRTGDKFYSLVLKHRRNGKILGTYVDGVLDRLKDDGRLHAQFMHTPSTWRLSCVNPNLQNIDHDDQFRRTIVAADDCYLMEADYSAIEAIQTGWYCNDPEYMRLAKLSIHGYLASHLLKRPIDLKWSDDDIRAAVQDIKDNFLPDYDRAKRCVHGTNFGLTPIGMVNNYPEEFTRSSAEKIQALYFDLCPKLKRWQKDIRDRAYKQGYLGGLDHPFRYKHWFWNVYGYEARTSKWTLGEDAKRCVAFYPQSTAAGVIKEAAIRIMEPGEYYIGDFYYGKTPIRALIHDSILAEVPKKLVDEALRRMRAGMTMPISQQAGLQIGVEIKVGKNWAKRSKSNPDGMGKA